jgi:hypothetical protein
MGRILARTARRVMGAGAGGRRVTGYAGTPRNLRIASTITSG